MNTHLVFVYGTLQQGHRNAHVNQGRTLPGRYRTVQRWPLYVIGPSFLPWLSHTPGDGEHVLGELVEVDDAALARMDALEQLDRPDWYRRAPIEVQREEGGAVVQAEAYFGAPSRLTMDAVHAGPLLAYTLEVAARFAAEPGALADADEDRRRFSTPRY